MARTKAAKMAAALTAILMQHPGNSARRQRERLLRALSVFGGVTTVEATRFLDIIDPRARVSELRKRGYLITTVPVARATECGAIHVVGKYVLLSAALQSTARKNGVGWMQLTLPLSMF
ncbi:helix-turn-helix domain-containing protein [Burkholderia sp. Bp9142]|uniref:helix-turn-helix domain-containing protein n=1 Tax=Burkholderia sp. Bp9142 TaxID=2184573 RepID=UPI0021AB31C2|nr:helix-turn-helix domain-containing protein [Burkholderia sp. Bp9142]